jgi:uncharacterized membrane protein YkvA (DUF1232 family)
MRLRELARVCWRCVRDPRVPRWPKLGLVAAVGYVLVPFDLVPDVIPLLGQLDDLTVLALAGLVFLACCPPSVVAEHRCAVRSSADLHGPVTARSSRLRRIATGWP